jgi:prepilin-type N-terminal cleavage/methylation domain-containing protein
MTGRARPRGRWARASLSGMTLLEVLAVIVIFSMLLGFSVLFFRNANRDLGVAASANSAISMIRGVRQRARGNAAPAWVVLSTKENSVYALVKETVGEWHFEDAVSTGAFGHNATLKGGILVPGRVGQGVRLAGGQTIDCGTIPNQSPDQGLSIEFWFLRKTGGGQGVLCTIGKNVEITIDQAGAVTARVGGLVATSNGIGIPLDAWCYLQLIYPGREIRLLLNRNPVYTQAGKTHWVSDDHLVMGDSRSGQTIIVDELRVGLILPQDTVYLASESVFEFPPGFQVPPNGEVVIAFDGEGRLDPAVHSKPVAFTIKSPTDRRDITVGLSGNVQK